MPRWEHPHWEAEFQAADTAEDLEGTFHALDYHDFRDLKGSEVTVYSAVSTESDHGGEYATARIDDGEGQTVYLVGGNAGKQLLTMDSRGMFPLRLVLCSVHIERGRSGISREKDIRKPPHTRYYWKEAI